MQPATGSPCWPRRKVLVTGTMEEMLQVDHPWVREYFHGPRARAALATLERNG
jgi:phospholipid/cholesterol/gamma-HCH transport system ATP-binding protein